MTQTAMQLEEPKTIGVGRSVKEIIKDLSEPIAERHLETRQQGGKDITYISWHNAVRYLDLYAPGWSSEITKIHTDGVRIFLVARISIPCLEGVFHREATGTEELNLTGWGDPSSNAESMALRRAAAKFGLGLYLYDKSSHTAPQRQQNTYQAPRPAQPPMSGADYPPDDQHRSDPPNSIGNQLTAKQLGMIRAQAKGQGIDEQAYSLENYNKGVADLTKKEASEFIDHLMALAKRA